jgi:hypothetical protein
VAAAGGTARLAGGLPPEIEKITPGPPLVIPMRPCDATASGAEESRVRLVKGALELCFCAHHASRFELELVASGWVITHDYRSRGE